MEEKASVQVPENSSMMNYDAIVLGAGKGERAGLGFNKVFLQLPDRKSVFEHALDCFIQDPDCMRVIAVCAPYEKNDFENRFGALEKVQIVCGGTTRQESVFNGLQQVSADHVLIHDGARPFVSAACVERIKDALHHEKAVIPVIAMTDTLIEYDADGCYVKDSPARSRFARVQTPQGFETALILKAHEQARAQNISGTDDAGLVLASRLAPVFTTEGSEANLKITSPEDAARCMQK